MFIPLSILGTENLSAEKTSPGASKDSTPPPPRETPKARPTELRKPSLKPKDQPSQAESANLSQVQSFGFGLISQNSYVFMHRMKYFLSQSENRHVVIED